MTKYSVVVDDLVDGRKSRTELVTCDRIHVSDGLVNFVKDQKGEGDMGVFDRPVLVVSLEHFISAVEVK